MSVSPIASRGVSSSVYTDGLPTETARNLVNMPPRIGYLDGTPKGQEPQFDASSHLWRGANGDPLLVVDYSAVAGRFYTGKILVFVDPNTNEFFTRQSEDLHGKESWAITRARRPTGRGDSASRRR